jgi:hypothetical protein
MKDFIIKNKMYFIAIVAFLAMSTAYFYPQTEGKTLAASDLEENKSMRQENNEHFKKTGERALWTNSMFGGMPMYQIASPAKGNLMAKVTPYLQFKIPRPIGRFFVMGMFFFIMLMVLKVDPWLAIIGGIAFAYNANNLILFKTGHMTKLICMSTFGIIFAGLYLLFQKKNYRIGFVLLVLGLVFNIIANHVQMTYYFGLTLILYFIIHIIYVFKNKENVMDHLLKPIAISVLALVLAVGANFTNLRTTYEYAQDTMRGKPILEKKVDTKVDPKTGEEEQKTSSNVDGLEWTYAMGWSYGVSDLVSSAVPRFVGGGSAELIKKDKKFYKDFKRMGVKSKRADRAINVSLYNGGMDRNTAGATYFGATIVFLFILGLFLEKGRLKWWLLSALLLTMLLSLGKNFEFFQRLFFDHVPFYNKFRTPNSIMTVTGFLFPILGFVVLSNILKGKISKDQVMKALKNTTYIFGGIVLVFVLIGPSMFNFSWLQDEKYYGTGAALELVIEARKYFLRMDSLRSLAFILLTAGAIWAFINQKIKKPLTIGILALLVVVDIWGVSKRYVNDGDFKKRVAKTTKIDKTAADEQILALEKERGAYRVYTQAQDVFNTAKYSYYHNSIGGYHPAKLQRIQDILDHYFMSPSKMGYGNSLNMLNAKYVVGSKGQLQMNQQALGNAWFVENIHTVNTPNEEIASLDSIDVITTAVVNTAEFGRYVTGFQPSKNGSISMTEYAPDRIVYKSNASSEQFAVFSEVWYGPDKGWKVKLNGENVPHVRANYLLRALKVPSGENTIEFYFEPDNFYKGEKVSMASSSALIILVLGAIAWSALISRRKEEEVIEEES